MGGGVDLRYQLLSHRQYKEWVRGKQFLLQQVTEIRREDYKFFEEKEVKREQNMRNYHKRDCDKNKTTIRGQSKILDRYNEFTSFVVLLTHLSLFGRLCGLFELTC